MLKVATPHLRILIVDDQPWQRLNIEKMLNSNGYYRVAPIDSLYEFLLLAEQAVDKFDLVVINTAIKGSAQLDLEGFFRDCPSVRNVLMYEGKIPELVNVEAAGAKRIAMKLSGTPDARSIQGLMKLVDPKRTVLKRRKLIGEYR